MLPGRNIPSATKGGLVTTQDTRLPAHIEDNCRETPGMPTRFSDPAEIVLPGEHTKLKITRLYGPKGREALLLVWLLVCANKAASFEKVQDERVWRSFTLNDLAELALIWVPDMAPSVDELTQQLQKLQAVDYATTTVDNTKTYVNPTAKLLGALAIY